MDDQRFDTDTISNYTDPPDFQFVLDVTLLERIDQYSSSSVYKGEYQGETVAVKLFDFKTNPNSRTLFKKEKEILSSFRTPLVVRYFGNLETETNGFIVIEYMNSDLKNVLHSATELTLIQIIHIARQIAIVMREFHRDKSNHEPFIHGSLKSLNVLINKHLKIALCNSGFAATEKLTIDAWTAPELLSGGSISKESDVYAFGMLCWELVSRSTPWHELNLWGIKDCIANGKRPSFPSHLPTCIENLINGCWATKPEHRFTFDQIVEEFTIKIIPEIGGITGTEELNFMQHYEPKTTKADLFLEGYITKFKPIFELHIRPKLKSPDRTTMGLEAGREFGKFDNSKFFQRLQESRNWGRFYLSLLLHPDFHKHFIDFLNMRGYAQASNITCLIAPMDAVNWKVNFTRDLFLKKLEVDNWAAVLALLFDGKDETNLNIIRRGFRALRSGDTKPWNVSDFLKIKDSVEKNIHLFEDKPKIYNFLVWFTDLPMPQIEEKNMKHKFQQQKLETLINKVNDINNDDKQYNKINLEQNNKKEKELEEKQDESDSVIIRTKKTDAPKKISKNQ